MQLLVCALKLKNSFKVRKPQSLSTPHFPPPTSPSPPNQNLRFYIYIYGEALLSLTFQTMFAPCYATSHLYSHDAFQLS